MTNNKSLFRGILVEQFNLDIMATQRDKESPKTSDVLLFLLKVVIPETKITHRTEAAWIAQWN